MKYSPEKEYIFIEEIKDERYKAHLQETVDFLDMILVYGQYIFGLIQETRPNKYSDSVLLFWLRDFLETLDGIKSLFSQSSVSSSKALIRNLFEYMLYFDYVFSDETLLESRALAYDVIYTLKKIRIYKLLDINDSTYEKEQNIIGKEILPNYSKYDLPMKVKNLETKLTKYDEYRKVYNEVLNNNSYKKAKKIPEWYSLHSKANSIRDLSRTVGMEKYYLTLYNDFSNVVHPGNAMSAFIVDNNNNTFVKNPKVPYNTKEVGSLIDNVLTFSAIYFQLVKHFLPDSDRKNYCEWHLDMRNKSRKICMEWEGIKFISVDENSF